MGDGWRSTATQAKARQLRSCCLRSAYVLAPQSPTRSWLLFVNYAHLRTALLHFQKSSGASATHHCVDDAADAFDIPRTKVWENTIWHEGAIATSPGRARQSSEEKILARGDA